MANDTKTMVLRGKLSYAKVLGDPVLNYDKTAKEWKVDFYDFPVKEIKPLGIGDRVKQKENYLDNNPFLTFKQSELKKDGNPNNPIKIEDISGNPWPIHRLLGNGTIADVKFVVMDFGAGKKKGVYIRGIRVLEHVPYDKQEFEPLAEDDEFAGNLEQAKALMEANAKKGENNVQAMDSQFKKDFIGEGANEATPEDLSDDLPF